MTDSAKPARRQAFPPAVPAYRPLTKRESRFVDEYLVDLRGEAAACRAGYSPKTARVQASRLLTRVHIAAALEAGYKERQARTGVIADATVREIDGLAKSDIRRFYDEHGVLLPIHKLPDDLAACVASVEIVKRNLTSGDGQPELLYKIRLWNKPRALELLGRHQGLFREEAQQPVADCPASCLPPGTDGVSVH